jgi:transposase InsO family protein
VRPFRGVKRLSAAIKANCCIAEYLWHLRWISTADPLQRNRASTAEWTRQQLREALPGDQEYKFLRDDRHTSFSAELDEEVQSWGIRVLRSPVRMPTANAHCERLIGTIRRECLDYVIPLDVCHLRRILREWTCHYNPGRPHRSLGPGIPGRRNETLVAGNQINGQHLASRMARRLQPLCGLPA